MAQAPKIIDLRRSYLPMDPNAFPPTLHGTDAEDNPENRVPVIPYDGHNFMPTPQGYCSFFGDNSSLGINALTANADYILVLQKDTYGNIAVALCDTGIWSKDLRSAGAWAQSIVLSAPAPGVHLNWSFCVIEDTFFAYRQGAANHWKWNSAVSYVFTVETPSFLTMANQLGIYKAGGRLGYWDNNDSFAWSAFGNTADFTPNTDTLAGNIKFQDVSGRVTTVHSHGDGFVIYATRSIVHVTRNVNSQFLWKGKAIFNQNGVSYRDEVCTGDPDTTHYVISTNGLCVIENGQPSFPSPETSTYLREKKEPIFLKLLNGRYLFLQFLNSYFLQGRVDFSNVAVSETVYLFAKGSDAVGAVAEGNKQSAVSAILSVMRGFESIHLFNNYRHTDYPQAVTPASVPKWAGRLHTLINKNDISAWNFGASTYFNSFFTVHIANSIRFVRAPTKALAINTNYPETPYLVGTYPQKTFTETGANNYIELSSAQNVDFYHKQDAEWYAEQQFMAGWKVACIANVQADTTNSLPVYASSTGALIVGASKAYTNFRPPGTRKLFVDMDLTSAHNKHYGYRKDSMWAQRTLLKTFELSANYTIELMVVGTAAAEAPWQVFAGQIGATTPFSDATILSLMGTLQSFYGTYISPNTYANVIANASAHINASLVSVGATGISVTLIGQSAADGYTDFTASVSGVGGKLVAAGRYILYLVTCTISGNTSSFVVYYAPQGVTTSSVHTIFITWWQAGASMVTDCPIGAPIYYSVGADVKTKSKSLTIAAGPDMTVGFVKELGYTYITEHGHYSGPTYVQDDTTDKAPDYDDIYDPTPPAASTDVTFSSHTNPAVIIPNPFSIGGIYGVGDAAPSIGGITYDMSAAPKNDVTGGYTVTIPSGTILLQEGSIEPIYPTFLGAFVFDTHYKKWGKMKYSYRNLVDLYPVNTMAGAGVFPYESFMPKMGARKVDGTFPIFDQYPADSKIVFGKVGFYRKGFSCIEEILFQHRYPSTGELKVEASIDGKSVDATLTTTKAYTNAVVGQEGFGYSAKWFDIIFTGYYDLVSLEPRMQRTSRR